ncbi:hypothetical protein GWC95_04875 [Sediminibacterium roseum]|uniref:Uncharacterized protein n=1 Tax=Sediminibacterium roseum TaxID=1978412 RepID=A0ABW9ZQ52_9BACT|nr:hypothetical protein [Sediminibacterium roseum]NCI49246.1 hypothetical protein [Sediminibacterium roseum]
MKQFLLRVLVMAVLVFIAGNTIAQPPPAWNETAVAKDSYNNVAKNRKIYVKINIRQGNLSNAPIWAEVFETVSDADGVFNIVVGRGVNDAAITPNPLADLSKVDWSMGPFFMNFKVAVAPTIPAAWWIPADNYVDIGTTELLSVPYAIYAGNATVTNVNTSIQPGPKNTFLVTDSAGNVNWRTPQAANTTVTTITNFNVSFNSGTGVNVDIPPNTTSVVDVKLEGVQVGDPILVTPLNDYPMWSIYSSWVEKPNYVRVRFANYTPDTVHVQGSQYKIVVIK